MNKLKTDFKQGDALNASDVNLITSTINELEDSATAAVENIERVANDVDNAMEEIGQLSDSVSALTEASKEIIEVTWQELKDLRDNSQLVPGKKYRITDYVTEVPDNYVISMLEDDSDVLLKPLEVKSEGYPFDLIVTAVATNKLSEKNVEAIRHGEVVYRDITWAIVEYEGKIIPGEERPRYVLKRFPDADQIPATWILKRYPDFDQDGKFAWVYISESDNMEIDDPNISWDNIDTEWYLLSDTEIVENGDLIIDNYESRYIITQHINGEITAIRVKYDENEWTSIMKRYPDFDQDGKFAWIYVSHSDYIDINDDGSLDWDDVDTDWYVLSEKEQVSVGDALRGNDNYDYYVKKRRTSGVNAIEIAELVYPYAWTIVCSGDDLSKADWDVIPSPFSRFIYSATESVVSGGYIYDLGNVIDSGDKVEVADYFSNSKLEAWDINYCLDNDDTRFDWAFSRDFEPGTTYTAKIMETIGSGKISISWLYIKKNPLYDGDAHPRWLVLNYSSERQLSDITELEWEENSEEAFGSWTQYFDKDILSVGEEHQISSGYSCKVVDTTIERGSEIEGGPGKGVIYYLKDEFNNKCCFDFKNLTFNNLFAFDTNDTSSGENNGNGGGIIRPGLEPGRGGDVAIVDIEHDIEDGNNGTAHDSSIFGTSNCNSIANPNISEDGVAFIPGSKLPLAISVGMDTNTIDMLKYQMVTQAQYDAMVEHLEVDSRTLYIITDID